jgi:hypothetical protein
VLRGMEMEQMQIRLRVGGSVSQCCCGAALFSLIAVLGPRSHATHMHACMHRIDLKWGRLAPPEWISVGGWRGVVTQPQPAGSDTPDKETQSSTTGARAGLLVALLAGPLQATSLASLSLSLSLSRSLVGIAKEEIEPNRLLTDF